MADGRLNKCKSCARKDVIKNRDKNIDYYRDFDRKRAKNPERIENNSIWANTLGKESIQQYKNNYTARNPKKKKAATAVGNAIRDGKLKRENCEVCGDSNTHGHHDDYDYPLIVRWLCNKHHNEWHVINGPGKNGV